MELVEVITSADRARFMALVPALLKLPDDAINIEEVDLHWQTAYAVGDVGTTSNALEKNITVDLSAAGNKAVQTQDPKLAGQGANAGDQVIGVFGVGLRFDENAIATIANARAILGDLEKSIVRVDNSNNRRLEILADTCLGTGSDILTDANATPGRGPLPNKRIRKFGAPFTIGKDQVLKVQHWIGRTAAWPVPFVIDFFMPALIARKK